MNTTSKRIYIQEVVARDGFQIEPKFVATHEKVSLINALSRAGIPKIEATSFASPKAIPTLADADTVMRDIDRLPGVEYAALVPNARGCERALAAGVDEINVVMSVSETHNLANLRMDCEQSLAVIREITRMAAGRTALNVSLSTAFGCPFEGAIADTRVFEFIDRLADIGIRRMTICDTTGMGNPAQVRRIFLAALGRWPTLGFSAHFHNTRGMGLANALAAADVGIDRFDASLGGLGGCPFAPGATGNVCTEDLVHMFSEMGYATGIDLEALLGLAARLPELVGHDVPGQVMRAGVASRRYAKPDWLLASDAAAKGDAQPSAASAQACQLGISS
jgi:hydroxymethylglutaryl-CoA lyase